MWRLECVGRWRRLATASKLAWAKAAASCRTPKLKQAQNTRPRAAPPIPVDPRQAALAVGQCDLCRAALEHASLRIPGREPFNLIQDFQGVFYFVQAVKLACHRFPRIGRSASARKFPQVEEFRLHFPASYKLCAQSFQVMVEPEAAAKGAVDKEEVRGGFRRWIIHVFFYWKRQLPASNPSPVPLRLMTTPAAGHPLPRGEGSQLELISDFCFTSLLPGFRGFGARRR
jgi:hypothetical protein